MSKDLRETFAQKDLNLQSYRLDNEVHLNAQLGGGNSTVIMDCTGNETLLQGKILNLQEGDISYIQNLEDSEAFIKSTNKKKR